MQPPKHQQLPVHHLASCFNKTSATYKFYWLLAIIQAIEGGDTGAISKKVLFSRMVSNAWFTVNYFKVSFGKSDILQDVVKAVHEIEGLGIHQHHNAVWEAIYLSQSAEIEKLLFHFDKNVPHWFLTPWYPKKGNETDSQRRKRIYSQSQKRIANPLYSLYEDRIEVDASWRNYLQQNAKLLKDFCYWNLSLFIQSKNPNVPDISNKLIKTAQRTSLTQQRTKFWDVVFDELGEITCIYTGLQLKKGQYDVEHFVPHAFVSHDLIWNLIPSDPSFNSFKSNKLPVFEEHFDAFFQLQNNACQIVQRKAPRLKLLQDYYTIFPDWNGALDQKKFESVIKPLLTIASNNGFQFLTR